MAAPPGGADAVAATPPPDDGGLTHDWSTLSGDVLCACFLRTPSRFFSLFPYIQQTLVASLVSGNSEPSVRLIWGKNQPNRQTLTEVKLRKPGILRVPENLRVYPQNIPGLKNTQIDILPV